MTSPKTYFSLEYETRLNRAINFIRQNLEKKLSLDEVAKEASFSNFYFHRIFSKYVGETLNDFIWRLRAEKAVLMLHANTASVQEIAYQCGFSNQSDLSKNLKKRYKMTPTHIRQHPELVKIGHSLETKILPGYHERLKHLEENVRFHTYPPRRFAYVRGMVKGTDPLAITLLWLRISRWAKQHNLFAQGAQCVGMMLDDPTITHPNRCYYDAGVFIPDEFKLQGPVHEGVIPAGNYVEYDLQGTPQELEDLFYVIYRGWFPKSGYVPGAYPPVGVVRKQFYEKPRGIIEVTINILLEPELH